MRILPSKRSHLFVLERSRVVCRDGRVEYHSDEGREAAGFNIPHANTSFVLLGPGSSITTEAVRLLKQEGVALGFCGSGGTPLLSAQDAYPDFALPADEYRDPRPMRNWIDICLDDGRRLEAAKALFERRLENVQAIWPKLYMPGPQPDPPDREIERARKDAAKAQTTATLLGIEGALTKTLYRSAAAVSGFDGFERDHGNDTLDSANPNRLLDHGNYLAYGLASVALWTLGISPGLSVVHGKTRRGGLVFDIADVIKDAIILPAAFNIASRIRDGSMPAEETGFRSAAIRLLQEHDALGHMFLAFEAARTKG
jgi:CRISPR-associated protein Cas1